MDTHAAAAGIPLLTVLKPRDRETVLRNARVQSYGPGEVVVAEGDPATRLYLIASGTASVSRSAVGTVGRLQAGDFFGELALIEEHGRTATVTAETDLVCIVVSAWEFRASLDEHPEMAVPMLQAIIRRIHATEHHGS